MPSAGPPPPSSHATSSPASFPYPSAASIAKPRDPPEPALEPTSKRVRSAQVAPAAAPAIKCEAPQDAELPAAAFPPVEERPLAQSQWFGSAAMQPASGRKSDADAANRAHQPANVNEPIHVPLASQRMLLGPERGFALLAEELRAPGGEGRQ